MPRRTIAWPGLRVMSLPSKVTVPPFDGSRIVTVFLPQRTYFKLMQYERYIFIAVFLLLFLGFLDGPLYALNNVVWDFLMWATSFVDKAVFALAGVSV